MTPVEIKSEMLNQVSHPDTPINVLFSIAEFMVIFSSCSRKLIHSFIIQDEWGARERRRDSLILQYLSSSGRGRAGKI